MKNNATHIICALLALVWSAAAFANAPVHSSLSAEQKNLISKDAATFDALPESARQRLADGANRWLQMSPQQRSDASRQMQVWQALSPDERTKALDRRAQFRAMPADEQAALIERHRRFLALPQAERDRLRAAYARDSARQSANTRQTKPFLSLDLKPLPPTTVPLPVIPSVLPGQTPP